MLLPRGSPVDFGERIDDVPKFTLLSCRDRESAVEGLALRRSMNESGN